ncbi:hypothetical protein B5G06_05150 [Flavonifractor sp. An52]|uniref:hypothetical protein n=1 Tax=Flavonifractor sp. An52 TaxID=1965642 RepID=UPI000B380411|nr:hypothetical protein [Flavonifractor sp. An52]OUN84429.1 hypothetical protein B5G06_05150 [Flavonifractor sp. An52]
MYDRLKKILPIVLIVIVAVFSVLYFFIGRQYGVEYQDALYFPAMEGDTMVYSANVDGQSASFTVEGNTVTYHWGDTVCGPYTVHEDPTAAPGGEWESLDLIGVEIREEDSFLFRGGYTEDLFLFIREDGEPDSDLFHVTYSVNSVEHDADGNVVDPHRPSLSTLIRFSQLPQADAHRGNSLMWFLGLFLAGIAALLIKFDDTLFRLHLSFRVKYPEDAEPSEWEIFSRIFSWIAFTLLSLGLFIAGLVIIS